MEITLQRQYGRGVVIGEHVDDSDVNRMLQVEWRLKFSRRAFILKSTRPLRAERFFHSTFFVFMYPCFLTREPDHFNVP